MYKKCYRNKLTLITRSIQPNFCFIYKSVYKKGFSLRKAQTSGYLLFPHKSFCLQQEHYQFLYNTLESTFPVQNGEVKQVQAAAVDSVQIVNETKEKTAEGEAEQPAGTTSSNQQRVEESTPLVVNGDKEEEKDKPEKESSAPTETTPLEDTSNGPTVTAEV